MEKILSNFVAFLENMNFTTKKVLKNNVGTDCNKSSSKQYKEMSECKHSQLITMIDYLT